MDRVEGQALPYGAEYSKSGRAACKKCKDPIPKDVLRMAVMVKSRYFDGMQPNWHHFDCFFARCRPKKVDDIAHFESLRWNDQEKIREKIAAAVGGPDPEPTVKGSGKRRAMKNGASAAMKDLVDFTAEYAKSSRSKCKLCEEQISKDEVRISKKDYESEAALQYGPHERWHHVDCFIKARDELGYWGAATDLPGFKTLSPEDQKELKKKIKQKAKPASDEADGVSPPKKSKQDDAENEEEKKEMKKQNDMIYKYRDNLKQLSKTELHTLLEFNNQDIPEGEERALDRLADLMTFGALTRCQKCKGGQLVFRSGFGYQCLGYLSEWSKCEDQNLNPKRTLFKVPVDLKEYPFLSSFKSKIRKRLFKITQPSTSSKPSSTIVKPQLPLASMEFVIHKTDSKTSDEIKQQIEKLGGKVVKKFAATIAAVISTNDELAKAKPVKIMKDAKTAEVQILPEDFFESLSESSTRNEVLTVISGKNLASWGTDPAKRLPSVDTVDGKSKSVYASKDKSSLFKSEKSGTVQKLTLKDGLAVDPDSQLDSVAHVYKKGKDIYSVVCSLVDVQSQKNSFYKLQVLEADKGSKYWLFRAWGRIGTTIGGNKVEKLSNIHEAISQFKLLFEDKTGNMWEMREQFEKVPGKMMMLDINYGEEKTAKKLKSSQLPNSKLPKSVQDLIALMFDIEQMKKTMLEFELDLNKMPLGKLSEKQIKQAFTVLSELQKLTTNAGGNNKPMIVDRTNRFYTLVPHDCGVNNPPLLDNEEIIKQKIDMLNSLMDIEIAYKLLQQDDDCDNPVDSHYSKLQTDISVLDKTTDEFKFIQTYVTNTHAKTHSSYTLNLEEVFKIERKGEGTRYKKFSKLPNKKLLWHGSRLTNFAGILSQGLRIAPPEAPVTGYMFGKGVYFADMVSKSANYCFTSKSNPTGLLLLCEVALGQIHELLRADYIEKLPPGKHSVKGVGQSYPDPSEVVKTPTGAEVPLGKGILDDKVKGSSLLYNEYIVYDVAQVKIQYLLKVNFKYNY